MEMSSLATSSITFGIGQSEFPLFAYARREGIPTFPVLDVITMVFPVLSPGIPHRHQDRLPFQPVTGFSYVTNTAKDGRKHPHRRTGGRPENDASLYRHC